MANPGESDMTYNVNLHLDTRKDTYQYCKLDDDCNRWEMGRNLGMGLGAGMPLGFESYVNDHKVCKDMGCLGKICVADPIQGCVNGFDCANGFNCVHPKCGKVLMQFDFGMCVPLHFTRKVK